MSIEWLLMHERGVHSKPHVRGGLLEMEPMMCQGYIQCNE